jgi:hypothetical protein
MGWPSKLSTLEKVSRAIRRMTLDSIDPREQRDENRTEHNTIHTRESGTKEASSGDKESEGKKGVKSLKH